MKRVEEVSVIGFKDYICSPCWTAWGREVPAVVAFETLDTVTRHFESINYCGNHAEVLHQDLTLVNGGMEVSNADN